MKLAGVSGLRQGRAYVIPVRKASIAVSGLLVLALCFLVSTGKPEQKVLSYGVANKVIVVDPGHGGIDSGASRGDVVEREITLAIGKRLAEDLSQGGAMVILLRKNQSDLAGDEFTGRIRERKQRDMAARVRRANEAKADLLVSVHTNAEPGSSWSGAQTFYQPGDEKSKLIAGAIQEELGRVLGNTKRKATAGKYYILEKTHMPAVIVEVGFISNPREAQLLTQSAYQSKVAYAIFAGIARAEQAQLEQKATGSSSKGSGGP